MSRRREFLFLILIIALAAGLRFVDLGGEGIWLDEAFSLDMAKYSYASLWNGEPLDPGNPPGYYLVLRLWTQTFGDSVESGRALSALMGVLTVGATWLVGWAMRLAPGVRLLATLLVAALPPFVYLSREVRVYTLFTFVVTLAIAAAEIIARPACETSRWQRVTAWGAFVLLASTFSYLHYYSFLLLMVLGLYLFARLAPRGVVPVLILGLAFAVIAASFLPWLPKFLEQIKLGTTRGGATWIMHLAVLPLYSLAGHTLVWKQDGMALVALFDAIAALCVYAPALYWMWRGRPIPWGPLVVSVGLILVAVAISVLKSPMLQSRYLVVIYPCLMILLAVGLTTGFHVWRRGARVASWTLAGLMLASLALMYTVRQKEHWEPVAGYVAKHGASMPAYCYEDMAKLSFAYYAPWIKLIPIDPVASHFSPEGAPWEESGLAGEMASHPHGFWFILYLSLPETMPEVHSIDAWLRKHFEVTGEYGDDVANPSFPLIHLYQLKPRS